LAYDGERADAQVLDQLEAILRHVADELSSWRSRAQKAEAELKDIGARGAGTARADPDVKARATELEQENRALRQRVEAAKVRVQDLLSRLTFLEEQARQAGDGGAGAGSGGSAAGAGAAS
jgi:chromosome segregation ATPase